MIERGLSFLLMLCAAVFAFQRAQEPEYIGIDFIQFHLTGRHVINGGDSRVYSDDMRAAILNSAWKRAQTENSSSKFYQAVSFRHERTWETYSSPFLYSVFGMMAGGEPEDSDTAGNTYLSTPSSDVRPHSPPVSGEKGRGDAYEAAINEYWIVCLGSTMIGFMAFGWVLRIPCWSMLFGAVLIVWFDPLRCDMNVANMNQIQFGMVGVFTAILGGTVDRSLRRPEWLSATEMKTVESRRRSDGCTVRHFIAGILLGICLAFKPSLLWCGVMWFAGMVVDAMRKKHHAERDEYGLRRLLVAAMGGITGGMLAIAFSSIWFPVHSWIARVQAVRSMPDDYILTESGNYSLTYFARRNDVPRWLTSLAGPMIALAVVATAIIQSRYLKTISHFASRVPESRLADTSDYNVTNSASWLAIGCQIQILTSNLVWYHYLVLCIPAFLVLTRNAVLATSRLEKCAVGFTIVWCLMCLGFSPVSALVHSSIDERVFRCGFANLMMLLMLLIRRQRVSQQAGLWNGR